MIVNVGTRQWLHKWVDELLGMDNCVALTLCQRNTSNASLTLGNINYFLIQPMMAALIFLMVQLFTSCIEKGVGSQKQLFLTQ